MPNFFGPAGISDLGLGDMLKQQVAGETDEERRKRLQQQQQSRLATNPMTAIGDLFGAGGRGISGGFGGYGR